MRCSHLTSAFVCICSLSCRIFSAFILWDFSIPVPSRISTCTTRVKSIKENFKWCAESVNRYQNILCRIYRGINSGYYGLGIARGNFFLSWARLRWTALSYSKWKQNSCKVCAGEQHEEQEQGNSGGASPFWMSWPQYAKPSSHCSELPFAYTRVGDAWCWQPQELKTTLSTVPACNHEF